MPSTSTSTSTDTYTHHVRLRWDGNRGPGTVAYDSYDRTYRLATDGKPELSGSADPAFRGDPARYNPEELFLGALAACHMLFVLSLCARRGIRVLDYTDRASSTLVVERTGGGRLTDVVLSPIVTVEAGGDVAAAVAIHEEAHERCFLANSVSVPVAVRPVVRAVDGDGHAEGGS